MQVDGETVAYLSRTVRVLEQRKASLSRELDCCTPVPRLPQQIVQNRLDEWRRLLRASTTQARAVLHPEVVAPKRSLSGPHPSGNAGTARGFLHAARASSTERLDHISGDYQRRVVS